MSAIGTFCQYQIALVAVGKTKGGAIDTFCEYQIVLVAVRKTRKYAKVMFFVNIRLRL